MLVSQLLKRTAVATSSVFLWSSLRVWEMAECRYRLWGMTVAPIMPSAPLSGVIPPISGAVAIVPAVGLSP